MFACSTVNIGGGGFPVLIICLDKIRDQARTWEVSRMEIQQEGEVGQQMKRKSG